MYQESHGAVRENVSDVKPAHSTSKIARVISIGYEKRSATEFVDELTSLDAKAVIDVRQSAFSMRPEFRKKKLAELLGASGIDYVHLPLAGNPFRKDAGNIHECLALYSEYLSESPKLMTELVVEMRALSEKYRSFAVLCYERKACDCHRTILLKLLKDFDFQFSLIEV